MKRERGGGRSREAKTNGDRQEGEKGGKMHEYRKSSALLESFSIFKIQTLMLPSTTISSRRETFQVQGLTAIHV